MRLPTVTGVYCFVTMITIINNLRQGDLSMPYLCASTLLVHYTWSGDHPSALWVLIYIRQSLSNVWTKIFKEPKKSPYINSLLLGCKSCNKTAWTKISKEPLKAVKLTRSPFPPTACPKRYQNECKIPHAPLIDVPFVVASLLVLSSRVQKFDAQCLI
jgi:hypothetical protein